MPEPLPLTTLPEWQALGAHAARLKDVPLRRLFADDPGRAERFVLDAAEIHLDYSKHRIDQPALDALLALAKARGLKERTELMFSGARINATEGRSVLH